MIEKLVEFLEKCSDAYYNSDTVLVTDSTYDAMVETLKRLSPEHPYLHKVGSTPRKGTNKVGRIVPMGTLSKYHTEDSVKEWLSKESDQLILIAPKYDGFGVELTYKDGYLVLASTRGDGHVGEDVTSAMMRVHNVPIQLPQGFENLTRVRGEAIIPREHHEKMKELGYSAMRNAVPGIVRSNRADALMYVDFIAYEFFDGNDMRSDQRDIYQDIFSVESWRSSQSSNFEELLKSRNAWGDTKENYRYEMDGVVLKTDRIQEDDLLCPTHQIAWKFHSNRRTTELTSVEYQMGLTGKFTPIGQFNEVEFQGAKLKRASLGNMTRLAKEFEGMTIGSLIEVSRRGDIIPYIESLAMINEEGDSIDRLDICPYCGTPLTYEDYEPRCLNKSCSEKLYLQIAYFVSGIGIKGIGGSLVRKLIEFGHIKSITDIYKIDPSIICSLPRQGKSAVEKWESLQSKWLTPLEIYSAYPFENLGEKVWKLVLDKFTPLEILNLTEEDLISAKIKGLGNNKINLIVTQVSENREEIEFLLTLHSSLR